MATRRNRPAKVVPRPLGKPKGVKTDDHGRVIGEFAGLRPPRRKRKRKA